MQLAKNYEAQVGDKASEAFNKMSYLPWIPDLWTLAVLSVVGTF